MSIYNEDIIDVELTGGNISRSFMRKTIGEGDALANRFGVKVMRNGNPVQLTGVSCVGYFIRSDGGTIPVNGYVTGNTAYVELPQACYAIEGQFSLAIKLSGGSVTGTVRIVDGVVSNTTTGTPIDPGTIIPSIETLLAAIDSAVASIPADYSNLWETLAPTFDSSSQYYAGQYVTYNGTYYKFIVNHTGSWDSEDVVPAKIGRSLTSLENYSLDGWQIVASTQEGLAAVEDGIYTDANTFPKNSIVALYLSGTAVVNHAPEGSWHQRAIVFTYSSVRNIQSDRSGTAQVWYDMTTHAVFYRACWESTQTWSEWTANAGDKLTGITDTYSISLNNDYLQTTRTAKAGVPLFVSGNLVTSGVSQNTYFRIIGFYNNNANNDVLLEYGNFSNTFAVIVPTRDYENIVIHGMSSDLSAITPYTATVTITSAFDNLQNLISGIMNSAKNSGIMTRYKTKYQQVCKLHGLSGSADDVLTIRLLNTNGSSQQATLFGLYGAEQSSGYDNLGNIPVNSIRTFTLSRNYAGFQLYVNTSGDSASIEYEIEAAVNLPNGIQKDVITLMNNSGLALNKHTCNIFHKVVCIGDSYTSGHIQLDDDPSPSPVNEDYAWPHFMEQLTGNEYVNCGQSGATTISWQTAQRGLAKAQSAGLAQAYIIGLMINDSATVEGGGKQVPVGSISDIGTNNSTFYAQMSKIIREVNTISPLAKIFVNTCPDSDTSRYNDYNAAVRNIVSEYASTYPVHCIDLARDYKDLYNLNSLQEDYVNWHYTALGYEQFAEIYAYILSDYIDKNVLDFQDVFKIPYSSN